MTVFVISIDFRSFCVEFVCLPEWQKKNLVPRTGVDSTPGPYRLEIRLTWRCNVPEYVLGNKWMDWDWKPTSTLTWALVTKPLRSHFYFSFFALNYMHDPDSWYNSWDHWRQNTRQPFVKVFLSFCFHSHVLYLKRETYPDPSWVRVTCSGKIQPDVIQSSQAQVWIRFYMDQFWSLFKRLALSMKSPQEEVGF